MALKPRLAKPHFEIPVPFQATVVTSTEKPQAPISTDFRFKTTPFKHQEEAFNDIRGREFFALFWEPGTGKSKVTIDFAADLWLRGEVDLMIVFAPNGVHTQWVEDEFRIHCSVPYEGAAYKASTKNKPALEVLASKKKALKVIAINSETMSHASGQKFVAEAIKGRRTFAVLDESHKFKTPGSRRTRAMLSLSGHFSHRAILTGTEFTTGYENLYTQYQFLSPRILECRSFTQFKTIYCVLKQMGPNNYPVIVGYKNLPELEKRVKPHTFFADAKDCLDLPPILVDKVHLVELTSEQKRLYTQVSNDFIAELKTTTLEMPTILARLNKLSQITSGHIQLGDKIWEPVDAKPRQERLLDLVDSARGQLFVWAEYQPDILQLGELFKKNKIPFVTYYGGNKDQDNIDNLATFKRDPSKKIFLATPHKGGTGLTILEATTSIFYNVGTSFVQNKQARKRNHRAGQTRPCSYHTILARGTIDIERHRTIEQRTELREKFRNRFALIDALENPDTGTSFQETLTEAVDLLSKSGVAIEF